MALERPSEIEAGEVGGQFLDKNFVEAPNRGFYISSSFASDDLGYEI